jgi:predicted Rossmann fold flavoprotein
MFDLVVLGGGAAGIFSALQAKASDPAARVLVLEKSAVLMAKVRLSGGGRCNVTHACFDPRELVRHYPRGGKELLGPLHRFQPSDTVEWFAARGVLLKAEADGRMFPVTNCSATIIQCLLSEADRLGVEIRLRQRVQSLVGGAGFEMTLDGGERLCAKRLLLATGSSPEGYRWAQALGHRVVPPVPSLFTFNVPTSPFKELSGVAVEDVELRLDGLVQRGPLLITHFGFSGPAVLKLSAWAARLLHERAYGADLHIDWLPEGCSSPRLPKSLRRALPPGCSAGRYRIEGKTTHKEEFVTCGGVHLKEVDFRTMESKICPGLYFAGEILDIDGVTGGFNFQNAWTTAFLAGRA